MSDGSAPDRRIRVQLDLKVPMRDGVLLSADLYRPTEGERFPALLLRTYYDNQNTTYVDWAIRFARAGYAVLLQDCRGRYDSDGVWRPYVDETNDGYDTQQWIGAQPWCDGNLGTFGHSYNGFTATRPAPLRSPYLKAVSAQASQEDNFGHIYCDGVLELWNAINFVSLGTRTLHFASRKAIDLDALYRALPLISALDDIVDRPAYRDFIRHSTFDGFWKSHSLKDRYAEIEAPALFITGWYDNLLHEGFKQYRGWKEQARSPEARARTKILVGPWAHNTIGTATRFGDVEFGPSAAVDIPGVMLRWFDRRLRQIDIGADDEAPIRFFVMGGNVWRAEWEWPLARTRFADLHLHSRGTANSVEGDGGLDSDRPGDEPPDRYAYDPRDPVPTLGGRIQSSAETGPRDRRPVERRPDVLVYTGKPLEQDLEVTGPLTVILHAASSAPDTDFTATLVDVHPDGQAIAIADGIVRARFRESLERPSLIEPGRVYEYRIDLWETSNLFRAGHRIRLEISSSSFPRFDRNLNTGEPLATATRTQTAEQTIFHDRAHPSRLVLPVIPP